MGTLSSQELFERIARSPRVIVIWFITFFDLVSTIIITTYSPTYLKKVGSILLIRNFYSDVVQFE